MNVKYEEIAVNTAHGLRFYLIASVSTLYKNSF